ncbi:MAG: nitroreductase family protein [Pseudomonadales bacterium]|nr:nitroreductase family protein [Pseudomonadales bacterium]
MRDTDPYPVNFDQRDPAPGVDPLFVERWSPRALRKVDVAEAELRTIFDAARWSPSCYNEQPWRFVTSTPASFATFLDLLVEANQTWARNAAVLGFLFADKQFARDGSDNALAVFDAGAAWMAMALQARRLGLYAHGMAGIAWDRAHAALGMDPERYALCAGFAIGALGWPESLPEPARAMERPSPRRPLAELWRQLD